MRQKYAYQQQLHSITELQKKSAQNQRQYLKRVMKSFCVLLRRASRPKKAKQIRQLRGAVALKLLMNEVILKRIKVSENMMIRTAIRGTFDIFYQLKSIVHKYHQLNLKSNVKQNTEYLNQCLTTLNELVQFSKNDENMDQWRRGRQRNIVQERRLFIGLFKLQCLERGFQYSLVARNRMFKRWSMVEKKSQMSQYTSRLKWLKLKIQKQWVIMAMRTWRRFKLGRKFLRWKYLLIFQTVQKFKKNLKFSLKSNQREAKILLFQLILKNAAKSLIFQERPENIRAHLSICLEKWKRNVLELKWQREKKERGFLMIEGIMSQKERALKQQFSTKIKQIKFLAQHSQVASQILYLRKVRILVWTLEKTAKKVKLKQKLAYLLRWKFNISTHFQRQTEQREKPKEVTQRGKVLKFASLFGIEKLIGVCQSYGSRFLIRRSQRQVIMYRFFLKWKRKRKFTNRAQISRNLIRAQIVGRRLERLHLIRMNRLFQRWRQGERVKLASREVYRFQEDMIQTQAAVAKQLEVEMNYRRSAIWVKRWQFIPSKLVWVLDVIKSRTVRQVFNDLKKEGQKGLTLQEKINATREMRNLETKKKNLVVRLNQLNQMNQLLSLRVKQLESVRCQGCSKASSSSHLKAIASSPGNILSSPGGSKTIHSRGGSTSHFLQSMQMNNSVIEEQDQTISPPKRPYSPQKLKGQIGDIDSNLCAPIEEDKNEQTSSLKESGSARTSQHRDQFLNSTRSQNFEAAISELRQERKNVRSTSNSILYEQYAPNFEGVPVKDFAHTITFPGNHTEMTPPLRPSNNEIENSRFLRSHENKLEAPHGDQDDSQIFRQLKFGIFSQNLPTEEVESEGNAGSLQGGYRPNLTGPSPCKLHDTMPEAEERMDTETEFKDQEEISNPQQYPPQGGESELEVVSEVYGDDHTHSLEGTGRADQEKGIHPADIQIPQPDGEMGAYLRQVEYEHEELLKKYQLRLQWKKEKLRLRIQDLQREKKGYSRNN